MTDRPPAPKLYPFRLFKEDIERRKVLVRHSSEKWGKKATYAEILRELQREKIDKIDIQPL